jgi:hypothetical protein
VEAVRRAFDAFNRRDWNAFAALMDEEVEADSRLAAMEGGYHGHIGIGRWWDDILSFIPDYMLEIEETRGLDDVVMVRFCGRGHGLGSDTPALDPARHASRWRNGKCVWWLVSSTKKEGLKAVGLSE